MKVELLKMWHRKPIGSVHEFPDGVANVLIRRKFAKLAEDKPRRGRPPRIAQEAQERDE